EAEQAAPVIISTPVTAATTGQAYAYDVNATGNPAPTYSLTTSPAGMTINTSTGVISWTPSAAGNFDVTVQAANGISPDATQSFTIAVTGTSDVKVWLEAESGSLVSPMVSALDTGASSGTYIWTPQKGGILLDPLGTGGYARYTFTVPEAANYVIWGRVLAATTGDDSFYVSMDGGTYALWDTIVSGVWAWDQVNNRGVADPVVYPLTAGQHTLIVKQREDGTKIDRILVTNNMQYVPQGIGE
ncbi:MAG: putative Ig domain-containing protein, partial [Nitrospirota bacterium]|nr:putative Ig domain-containing protein [Nitrospirota bacterium]